jgi:DNA-binding GntR family transcriptional regulator
MKSGDAAENRANAPTLESGPLRNELTRVSALAIAQRTAKAIERGVYPPASRLKEQELAELFNCSRAPVREALRILESQGLVVIEPMKGARVASIDDESFYEVFLIRRALSGLLVEQLAIAPDSAPRNKFIAAANSLEVLAETGVSQHAFAEAVNKAIGALAKASSMNRTIQLVQSLTFGHQAFQAEFLSTDRRRLTIARTWRKLGQSVEARQPKAARAAVEKLFDLAFRFVAVWMKTQQATEQPPAGRRPRR